MRAIDRKPWKHPATWCLTARRFAARPANLASALRKATPASKALLFAACLDSLGIGHVTASRISAIGQWTLYKGDSALRGGRAARIEPPGRRIDDLQIT